MKVKELIEKLSKIDQEAVVILPLNPWEGAKDAKGVKECDVAMNVNLGNGVEGLHEIVYDKEKFKVLYANKEYSIVKGVYIS